MSYFQSKFSGAGFQQHDARQTRAFIARQKQADDQQKEKDKQLIEEQKKLSLLAEGMGMSKAQVQTSSRGELQGFIQAEMNHTKKLQEAQEQSLNLQKFQHMQRKDQATSIYNANVARAQVTNAQANAQRVNNETALLKQKAENGINLQKFVSNKIVEANGGDPNDPFFDPADQAKAQKFLNENPRLVTAVQSGQSPETLPDFLDDQKAPRRYSPSYDMSPMQRKIDETFAVDMADYDGAVSQIQVEKIEKVMNWLEQNPSGTGSLPAFAPDWLQKIMGMDLPEFQQKAESVIQMNLRETLGAQFAEKEGIMFMQRGFDPKLKTRANMDKLRELLKQIRTSAYMMRAKVKYASDNQTLEGFNFLATPPMSRVSTGNNNPNQVNTTSGNLINIQSNLPSGINVAPPAPPAPPGQQAPVLPGIPVPVDQNLTAP